MSLLPVLFMHLLNPLKGDKPMLTVRCLRFARHSVGRAICAAALAGGALAVAAVGLASPAQAAVCTPAGTTGLTAATIATNGQTITGVNLNATGCDVGIYVGSGINNVTITGTTVSGANDEGILAEGNTGLMVTASSIINNTVNPNMSIPDGHAVMLDGVVNASITNNTITGNNSGGIGLADNGPVDPGTPNPGPGTPVASTGDTISGNMLSGNTGGCEIIVEAWNPGGGISGTLVQSNTITGTVGKFGPNGPDIGQIVVADDALGASVTNTTINANTVTQSFVSGITLHANAPNDVISNTAITNNVLSQNNWGDANGAPSTDAIALIVASFPPGIAASITGTSISANTITNQVVAIWINGATSTTVGANNITLPAGGTAVYNVPTAGGGYWMAGSDGGVFSFGNSVYYGSAPGLGLNLQKPIVAMAPSRDRGGYWELGADGGVLGFGDSYFYGSLPGVSVHVSNIVGMAVTPASESSKTKGLGYWIVGSDGGVFSFGDAKFFGSVPGAGVHVNNIVGIAATSDGGGYWIVGSDGGVFGFGDATYAGSLPGLHVNVKNIVNIVATPDGGGYWLIASDGGVFSFGDAKFFGSVPGAGVHVNNVVGLSATPDGAGYWAFAADGGAFSFGDAKFFGSVPGAGVHINNVVGGAST
jgi:hypothetical protein